MVTRRNAALPPVALGASYHKEQPPPLDKGRQSTMMGEVV